MPNEEEKISTTEPTTPADVNVDVPIAASVATSPDPQADGKRGFVRRDHGERKKNPRKAPRREARVKPEFDNKMVSIRRVTRVVAGGRRFSFSVTLVAGNRKGTVGVGQGKASDTPIAIDKAMRDAKKNMIQIHTTKDMSIPHEVAAKYGSSRVLIMPAPGRGMLAGSSIRTVLELAGLTGINAKLLSGSKNRANNAKAAVEALRKLARTQVRTAVKK
jgi:small subunit ribosomal protein S5